MSSAFEGSKVSDVLKKRVAEVHLADESALRALFSQLSLPGDFDGAKEFPRIAKKMAEQTALHLDMVVSAATIVLSHSTTDDVFTEVCDVAIELDSQGWTSELNPERKISLGSLIRQGSSGVLADELKAYRRKLGAKSLPERAELLFRHVAIRHHAEIPRTDPAYFTMRTLREADELRNNVVHGSGLPNINPVASRKMTLFLHEAAFVAIRSVMFAYKIPVMWEAIAQESPGDRPVTGNADD
jgi:hypothetical protein